ncbi:cytochrome c oxidase subunit 8B, mitochondrial-like [Castor canadensis]|uniref:Cytochrome c oxidase subunit 8 n=1 Tax=Castor canadensis TaxID=51338 RepID=A0A8C0X3V3_CASCN|nr:cytochrome c oxidase subunit 8B, mitochondrial-like [Castor canadensis]
MPRLPPALKLLQAPLRCWVVPRAYVSAKPARTPTGPMEQTMGIVTFFVCILAPAGWVLSNLENYKKSSTA